MRFKDLVEGKIYVVKDSRVNKYELKEGLLWNKDFNMFSVDRIEHIASWVFEEHKEHYTFDQAYEDCRKTGQSYERYRGKKSDFVILENDNGVIRVKDEGTKNYGRILEGPGIAWVKID